MEPGNFEQQLKRQVIKQVPEAWREEILSEAQRACLTNALRPAGASALYAFKARVLALLWPSPAAWAALAAVWLAIAVFNIKTGNRPTIMAGKSGAATQELVAAWKEQERLLSEVVGAPEPPMP